MYIHVSHACCLLDIGLMDLDRVSNLRKCALSFMLLIVRYLCKKQVIFPTTIIVDEI